MKTIIESSEVKRILEMHSKLKKKPLLEQEVSQPSQKEVEYKLLQDAQTAGCLKNGKIRPLKGGQSYAFVGKTKSGLDVIFYPNMTYRFYASGKTGKWKCSKLEGAQSQQSSQQNEINQLKTQFGWKTKEDLKDITQEELTQLYQKHPKFELFKLKVESGKVGGYTDIQQKFIDQAQGMGYKLQLTPKETASGKYKQYKVPNSENYFPGGLTMFYSSETAVTSGSDIQQSFSQLSQGQAPETRKECAEAIKTYYEAWETRRDIPQNVFDPMKRRVQACVNTHGKKFKSLGGILSNVDNYIDTLSGGSGGPLSYGEDAKWRISQPRNVRR
jgi:hypothetical protein